MENRGLRMNANVVEQHRSFLWPFSLLFCVYWVNSYRIYCVVPAQHGSHPTHVMMYTEALWTLMQNIGHSRKRDCVFFSVRYKIYYLYLSFLQPLTREYDILALGFLTTSLFWFFNTLWNRLVYWVECREQSSNEASSYQRL